MAISLIAKPQDITPAYNPMKFIYDSTNKNELGFRYIFDVYLSGTATKIAEYRPLPNPDGYGEQDLSRLLQNYVSHDFNPTNTTFFDPTNCYYFYDVKIGEMYIETINYTSSLTASTTNVQINVTNTYTAGDQITIEQVDGGAANPNLEGLFTVLSATGSDFVVNSLWAEINDATIDGAVQYADKRKTITRSVISSLGNYAFNGALTFSTFRTYDHDDYVLTAITDLPLTSSPLNLKNKLSQDMWVNFIPPAEAPGFIYFENSTSDIFRKPISTGGLMACGSVGANNFGSPTLVSGTGVLIEDDVDYYDYWYADNSGIQKSIKHRITLDRRCTINDYEIIFMDRLGSVMSFAFQLREMLTGSVKKETYNQKIEGTTDGSEWGYESYDKGMKVVNPRIDETYELNTNFMTEAENVYYSELISSPNTYIKIDNEYFSCIVQDTGYDKVHQRNKNLIRKTIKVKLSVQDRVNG